LLRQVIFLSATAIYQSCPDDHALLPAEAATHVVMTVTVETTAVAMIAVTDEATTATTDAVLQSL
jgi:tRNA(Met) C34 N-acetyltransferase TmcA